MSTSLHCELRTLLVEHLEADQPAPVNPDRLGENAYRLDS